MFSLKTLPLIVLLIASACAQKPKIRYMPFGDSITEIVCWRGLVWSKLQTDNYTNVQFVGSGTNQNPSGCPTTTYDKDNEGHSGFLAIDIANKKQLTGWLKTNPADVITMHLGTNDITRGDKTADIIAAFTTLVKVMRDSNPNMKIIVAKIIPIAIGSYSTQVNALNAAIPAWATSLNSTASPIFVVDQNTGISSSDLRDGIHPNTSGDQKMAAKWYPALVNAFKLIEAKAGGKMEVEFVG